MSEPTDCQWHEFRRWKALMTSAEPKHQEDFFRLAYRYCWNVHKIDLERVDDRVLYDLLNTINKNVLAGVANLSAYHTIIDVWVQWLSDLSDEIKNDLKKKKKKKRNDSGGDDHGEPVG